MDELDTQIQLAHKRLFLFAFVGIVLVLVASFAAYWTFQQCSWIPAGGSIITMIGVFYGFKTTVAVWASPVVRLSQGEIATLLLIVLGTIIWGYGGLILSHLGDARCWP